MPNWCTNYLTVIGPKKELDLFINQVQGPRGGIPDSCFSLNALIPCPQELVDAEANFAQPPYDEKQQKMVDKYGFPSWYEWRLTKWGCKWDVDEVHYEANSDIEASYQFDSAWSPPEEWVKAVAKVWKNLNFFLSYEEGGNDFSGYLWIEKGEIKHEESGDYSAYHRENFHDKEAEFVEALTCKVKAN